MRVTGTSERDAAIAAKFIVARSGSSVALPLA